MRYSIPVGDPRNVRHFIAEHPHVSALSGCYSLATRARQNELGVLPMWVGSPSARQFRSVRQGSPLGVRMPLRQREEREVEGAADESLAASGLADSPKGGRPHIAGVSNNYETRAPAKADREAIGSRRAPRRGGVAKLPPVIGQGRR